MTDKNKELEHGRLVANFVKAKNDHERDLARKNLAKFTKKNPELVDEVQSRRWTVYGF